MVALRQDWERANPELMLRGTPRVPDVLPIVRALPRLVQRRAEPLRRAPRMHRLTSAQYLVLFPQPDHDLMKSYQLAVLFRHVAPVARPQDRFASSCRC